MISATLQKRLNHLQKHWPSCLICIVLFVAWQYSVGIPLLSFQNLVILLAIPLTFASFDFSYTNYKNVRQKLSKRSQQISMFSMFFGLALSSIWMVHVDTFHTDALHYLLYFCILVLWLLLLFRAGNKE